MYRTRTNGNVPKALAEKFGLEATRKMCVEGIPAKQVIIPVTNKCRA